jgi:hypothetical protein
MSIQDIVRQALSTGLLHHEAEQHLRRLLQTTQYGKDDLNAFMKLQLAVMRGHVKQESRERRRRAQKPQTETISPSPVLVKRPLPHRKIEPIAAIALDHSLEISHRKRAQIGFPMINSLQTLTSHCGEVAL